MRETNVKSLDSLLGKRKREDHFTTQSILERVKLPKKQVVTTTKDDSAMSQTSTPKETEKAIASDSTVSLTPHHSESVSVTAVAARVPSTPPFRTCILYYPNPCQCKVYRFK